MGSKQQVRCFVNEMIWLYLFNLQLIYSHFSFIDQGHINVPPPLFLLLTENVSVGSLTLWANEEYDPSFVLG